ncbi:hypothetical protein BJ944DRAFT_247646 [Cunninghamella echinulata]|nr:hypothetical protein BJ944DRAFT_247646 [Cunninghamella echinulata]
MPSSMKAKKKTVPCEGCRERKKRCTGTKPCDRCVRLNIECIHLEPTLPPDRNYSDFLKKQEVSSDLIAIQNEMNLLEQSIEEFQKIIMEQQNNNNKKLSTQRKSNNNTNNNNSNSNSNNNWHLSITKHGMSISMSTIKAYMDLLNQMKNWQQVCQNVTLSSYQIHLSATMSSSSSPSHPSTNVVLHRQFPLWLLRRGYYFAVNLCFKSKYQTTTNINNNISQNTLPTLTSSSLSPSSSTSSISFNSPIISNNPTQSFEYEQQQHPSSTSPFSSQLQFENENENENENDYYNSTFISSPLSSSDYLFDQYPFDIDVLLQQIVDAFFSCYLSDNLYLHKPTFYRLYVTCPKLNGQLSKSPVICALCAAALTIRCRHILRIIPYLLQVQLSELLYQRARNMVSFDEPSLDTFTIFTFLAMYKNGICCMEEAKLYLDLAYRTRCILILNDDKEDKEMDTLELLDDDSYNNTDIETLGIQEMVRRLHWAFRDVQNNVDFLENRRGVPLKTSSMATKSSPSSNGSFQLHPLIRLMLKKKKRYTRRPLPDENVFIHRTIQYYQYQFGMMGSFGRYIRDIRFGSDDQVALSVLADIKYKLDLYYYSIPQDYRMEDSLFEQNISDETFIQRLQEKYYHRHYNNNNNNNNHNNNNTNSDYNDKMLSIATYTSLQYHQGIITLFEPYLPDFNERQYASELGFLEKDNDTPLLTSTAINKTNNNNTSKKNDQQNCNNINNANETASPLPTSSSSSIPHQLHAQQQCTHAATVIVRILDYQRKLSNYCRVSIQVLLSAWDIHLRNACLGMNINDDDDNKLYFNCLTRQDILQARKSLLLCLSLLQEGYLFNFAEQKLWEYYQHVERLLYESLSISPNSAPFWTPMHN